MNENLNKISDVAENLALYINHSNGQKRLQATRRHNKGSLLHRFSARERLARPTYLSVQVGRRQHIHLDPEFLQYINHSCEPNVFFDVAKHEIHCLRNIEVGEEITFFYPSTEWSMDQAFECACGQRGCLGIIGGAAYLTQDLINRYRFADHIIEKLGHHR